MRNLSLSHILAILLLTACIYKLFINQTKITQGITPPAPGTITKVSQGTLAQVKTKGTGAVSLTKQRPRPNANNGEPTEELPPSRANARNQKSLEQVKDFQSRAHLEFTPPPGFEFVEIDNDDEFLILAGKNHDDHHLTMIAGRVQATDQQVKPFLNENIGC